MPLLIPAIKIAPLFLILLSSALFFSGSEAKFFCWRCSCVVCAWIQIRLFITAAISLFFLIYCFFRRDETQPVRVLPYCWISLAKRALPHLLMRRELVLYVLPLSGLLGRARTVWGSFLFSILVIFPLHWILSVASFKLRTCVFSYQRDCWWGTGILLQKMHAWRVRVPHAISSKIFLLFKALQKCIV